jgi:CheY-like chemotaxis protein
MQTKNILLVEDDEKQMARFMEELIEIYGYEATCATSIREALDLFPTKQWDVISMDGCIGGEEFNSIPLIRRFKAESHPECVIIAASSSSHLGHLMLEAGCTCVANKKDHVPGIIDSVFRRR